jgi:hypothetical protein
MNIREKEEDLMGFFSFSEIKSDSGKALLL